jgi:SAM-dependent methyltransferase
MDKSMYQNHFKIQKKHWWFVTKKKIILDLIAKYLPKTQSQKILDIGCGSGLMLESLKEVGQTFGMDMDDDAISFSKEIFSGPVEKGMLPNGIPYPNESFSFVVLLDVIEHVDNPVEALKAVRARLMDGGKAFISVPAFMFLWSGHDDRNNHKIRYDLPLLKAQLLEAGFTVEAISYFNTLLFPIVYIVRKLNNLLGRDGASDVEMPGAFTNYILTKIFGIERYLLNCMSLPFGVSILAVAKK